MLLCKTWISPNFGSPNLDCDKNNKVQHFYMKICTKEGMMLDFPKIVRIDNLSSFLNKHPLKFNEGGGGAFFGQPCIVSTVKLVQLVIMLLLFKFS